MEKVIIFGVGKFFRENEQILKEKYEIACFLDNNIEVSQKNKYYNRSVPIYNPEEIRNFEEYPIIVMTKRFVELFYQLMDLGVDEKRIIIGILLFPKIERERIVLKHGKLEGAHKKLVYQTFASEKILIENQEDFDRLTYRLVREKYYKENKEIEMISDMPTRPIGRDFGSGRGKPIDRYYIENFLDMYKKDIQGDVLEIADNSYTLMYGSDHNIISHVLHINGWGNAIKGNLETGEGLEAEQFDTLILTQTLMFIYDLKSTASNIYKIMRNNATALITVAGISQISRYDADNWGSYWGFHVDAIKKLFVPLFGEENVKVKSYGNVKTAIAMLYGLCCEELKEEDFKIQDEDYPVILTIRLQKRNSKFE